MVLSQVGVRMGAFASNTTLAWLAIWVLVVSLLLGITVN